MKNPRLWIGMALSVIALVVTIFRVDFGEAREAFRQADYIWFLPATGFALVALIFRSLRWRALLHPLEFTVRDLFGVMVVGYTVNAVLPLRAGDVVRAHLMGQRHGQSRVRAFTTIAVEHLVDVVVVVAIFLSLAPFLAFPDWAETATMVAIVIVAASAAIIAWLWLRRETSLSAVERLAEKMPLLTPSSVRELLDTTIEGFSALQSWRASAVVVLSSALTWISGGIMMWLILVAFELPHSFLSAMFLVSISAIALAIPSSPGFIGVYHVLLIEAATLVLGVSSGAAAGFAVVTHLLLFVPPVILGVGYMLVNPQIWDDLLRWRRKQSA